MRVFPSFRAVLHLLAFSAMALAAWAQGNLGSDDPFGMTLEELMEEPVLSAAKQEEPLFDATSAIFVVDQKSLRMTPADTIPDILRYAPGIVVAQGNSYNWSLSSRSNPNRFTNELLALRDGRSIYNSIYSGVFWELQRFILDDIERVEVLKGSGGALWGSNAVNGVINILSKPAWETPGWRFEGTFGNQIEYGFGLRYGGQVSEKGFYRVSLLAEGRDGGFHGGHRDNEAPPNYVEPPEEDLDPHHSADDAETLALAARYDFQIAELDFLKVELDAYSARVDEHFLVPSLTSLFPILHHEQTVNEGVSLLARWDHLDDGSGHSFYLQGYVDFYRIDSIQTRAQIGIQDLEGLYRRRLGEASEVVIGGGVRVISDDYSEDTILRLRDSKSVSTIFNTFFQYEQALTERFLVRLGTKLEYHPQSVGLENQPTLRLLYKLGENQRLWFAASSTSRVPSRTERDLNRTLFQVIPVDPADYGGIDRLAVIFTSQPDLEADRYYALEAGYRIRLRPDLSFDISAYRQYMNHGVGIQTTSYAELDPIPHIVLDNTLDNSAFENAVGAEASLNWTPHEWFTLRLSQTYITRIQKTADVRQPAPHHQTALSMTWKPAEKWTVFSGLRYQSQINGSRFQAPSRWDADASVRWEINDHASFILRGQHLFRARHYEYIFNVIELLQPIPVERQISARLEVSF